MNVYLEFGVREQQLIENLINALSQPTVGWQPLSTALKNGKPILVRVKGERSPGETFIPFVSWFDDHYQSWMEDDDKELDPRDFGNPDFEWRPLP